MRFGWRTWWSIGFAFAVPILVGLQLRRAWAAAVTLAYFGAASWPAVRAYAAFAGTSTTSGAFRMGSSQPFSALPLTAAWNAKPHRCRMENTLCTRRGRCTASWPDRLGVSPRFSRSPFPRNGLSWPSRLRYSRLDSSFSEDRESGSPSLFARASAIASQSRLLRRRIGRAFKPALLQGDGSRERMS